MPSVNRWLRGQRSNGGLPADDAPKRRHSPFVVLAVKLEQSCGMSGRASSQGSSRQCKSLEVAPSSARKTSTLRVQNPSIWPASRKAPKRIRGRERKAGWLNQDIPSG
ncbi:hypothetical protein VCV18_005675 [Metarhizium anisopliae]